MKDFEFKLTKELQQAAVNFENFRADCKNYLRRVGLCYDKFTVVAHDSYVGFITEIYIRELIEWKFGDRGFITRTWSDNFDLDEINRIVYSNDYSEKSSQLVAEYFYDPYDIEIINGNRRVFIDVKTALTKLTPSLSWDFMYPVVQANKDGKDYMVLVYFITNDGKAYSELKQIDIIGFTNETSIRKCNVIKKGSYTRFGTQSLTDNYETSLSRDYSSFEELFDNFDVYSHL
ncbi:hypothetical protein [Acholeplasma equifetale]|uniref:hypothetical protein n=1 Tax=Acholeplasma equifetale TaxID=264634 RepID=UPI00047DC25C|nr:hypothetical protein [Acholeplasma equifetale]